MISVIIPTLNEEKYIENLLKALKSQDYNKKFEIIVADSNSKDKTVKIARKYTDKVVVIKKRAPGAGRNAGAKLANGNILVFLDADAIPLYNFLKTVEKTFKNKKVIAATCPILPTTYGNQELFGLWLLNEFILKASINLGRPVFATICFVCRKDVFERAGGFDEKLKVVEDIEFSSRLRKFKGEYKFMANTLVLHSTRRLKKWRALKLINAWPLGYLRLKTIGKVPSYRPVR